ncbi:hypothetical protein [Reinekea sp. G2M2-21]|uniref:hypothetical protein n=1 Tax=Reinekea sp. G2M2-21 TaxID=2788942 RepID=UPI0018AB286F|nr:hypothetical protein [Reinekea sp. G2M2-21]
MNKLAIGLFALVSALMSASVFAAQTITIDLGNPNRAVNESFVLKKGTYNLKFINLVASDKQFYRLNVDSIFKMPTALSVPDTSDIIKKISNMGPKSDPNIANFNKNDADSCTAKIIQPYQDVAASLIQLYNATTEPQVKVVRAVLKSHQEALIAESPTAYVNKHSCEDGGDGQPFRLNVEEVKEIRSELLDQIKQAFDDTEITEKITARTNTDYQVVLTKENVTLYSASFIGNQSRWRTHYGLSFIQNMGTRYYSEQTFKDKEGNDIATAQYKVAKAQSQEEWLHSVTAIWTLPFESLEVYGVAPGFSAGLGLNEESVTALFGPSLLIGENVLLNIGFSISRQDALSPAYAVGDYLGEKPSDSTDLTVQQYKTAMSFTMGLRF